MRKAPSQKPGNSRQDYGTPGVFLDAVEARFGHIAWDLAAHYENNVCEDWIGPGGPVEDDSLSPCISWRLLSPGRLLWLNPPFSNIEPWAHKCSVEAHYGARIAMLTPASVGSEWFRRHVFGRARVLFLSPRLTFLGCKDPYPKDCMLSVFGEPATFECWRWDRSATDLQT